MQPLYAGAGDDTSNPAAVRATFLFILGFEKCGTTTPADHLVEQGVSHASMMKDMFRLVERNRALDLALFDPAELLH